MATIVEQTHMADGEFLVHTTDAAARRVIKAALRDRMRACGKGMTIAAEVGCEEACLAFLHAHNEASDVLAGIEAGT